MRSSGFALVLALAVLSATSARADIASDCTAWRKANGPGAPYPTVCLAEKDGPPPFFEGIGATKRELFRDDFDVQPFFNQGLRFYYAFNFREAYRAFRHAALIADSRKNPCGYCYWGIAAALSVRPGSFLPPEPDRREARIALTKASEIFKPGQQPQQKIVGALLVRNEDCAPNDNCAEKRAADYHDYMRTFWSNYTLDPEITVLYADAILGAPTADRLAEGRTAMKIAMAPPFNEIHTGLWHWYLHLMEASAMPQEAEAAADRLGGMAPQAGHLVHMPSHIYFLLGKPDKAVASDTKAAAADEKYFDDGRNKLNHPDGDVYRYDSYPHVLQSLAAAALMRGQKDVVDSAAARLIAVTTKTPGSYRQDTYRATYYLSRLPLATFENVAEFPKPDVQQPLATVAYYYAQTRAEAWIGEESPSLELLDAAVKAYPGKCPDEAGADRTEPCLVAIMYNLAHAYVDAAAKNWEEALARGEIAVQIQSRLRDGPPGSWVLPVKQTLASFYIRAMEDGALPPGIYVKKAQDVLNESLKTTPGNGWAYFGLWDVTKFTTDTNRRREAERAFRAHWAPGPEPRLDHM